MLKSSGNLDWACQSYIQLSLLQQQHGRAFSLFSDFFIEKSFVNNERLRNRLRRRLWVFSLALIMEY